MKISTKNILNDTGEKVPALIIEPESTIEVELLEQLSKLPGYLEHVRNQVEHTLDELSDPPNGPEDF